MNSFGLICCVPYHMICEHRCAQYPGNADMLLSNGKYLDEGTRRQIYTDIYDDAEWLTGVVENLLSITRLNDGRLKFKFTDQLMDEVITEALRHISRKHDDYKIITECEPASCENGCKTYYSGSC